VSHLLVALLCLIKFALFAVSGTLTTFSPSIGTKVLGCCWKLCMHSIDINCCFYKAHDRVLIFIWKRLLFQQLLVCNTVISHVSSMTLHNHEMLLSPLLLSCKNTYIHIMCNSIVYMTHSTAKKKRLIKLKRIYYVCCVCMRFKFGMLACTCKHRWKIQL
jgi:hypothetical protein